MSQESADGALRGDGGGPRQTRAESPLPPIAEVARSLAAALGVGEVMQRVAEGALRLTHARGAYVERIASARDEVEIVAVAGRGAPPLGTRVAFPGSLSEVIIGGSAPGDLAQMTGIGEAIAPYLAESCRRCSALVVPLISEREALGSLVLLRGPGSPEFPPSEIADARVLADLASLSLRRILLVERSEQERTRIAALLESTGEGIYGIDREGRCTFVNPAAAQMVGYTPEECLGRDMHELIHHHHPDGTPYPLEQCPVYRAFQTGEGIRMDDEVLWRKDGTCFPAEYASYPILQDGHVTGAVVTFVDIAAWKSAERERQRLLEEARAARAQVTQMLMHAPAAMALLTGPEHRIEIANEHFLRLSENREVIGRAVREAYPDLEGQVYMEQVDRVYETGEPWEVQASPVRYDRHGTGEIQLYYFDMRLQPIRDAEGRVYAVLNFAQDVTEAVHARQAIEAARAEAEEAREAAEQDRRRAEEARREADEANRAKSEFLATMSHEIRTPLNAILGYTDLLELGIAGPVTEGQKAHLAPIKASAEHLVGLINEILDLAKVESGRMSVEHERALASDAMTASLALVGPQAAQKGIAVENPCADDTRTFYIGDQDRVRQILVNLLSNSVKFTPAGGRIVIACGDAGEAPAQTPLSEQTEWTFIRVSDSGIGIASDQLDTIFDAFVQVDRGHSRNYGGTGLGLAISRQLARLMGGDLTVESEPGEGSTFTLWLPRTTPLEDQIVSTVHAGEAPRGSAKVGEALLREVSSVMNAYRERLRTDPEVPMAAGLGDADLEDHQSSFLSDLGAALVTLEASEAGPLDLLRDGGEIRRVIADLHGKQRARLGWTETALHRECEILWEEIEAGVRRGVAPGAEIDVESALVVLKRLLEQGEGISLRALQSGSVAANSSRRGDALIAHTRQVIDRTRDTVSQVKEGTTRQDAKVDESKW